jgi:hypothetical protein
MAIQLADSFGVSDSNVTDAIFSLIETIGISSVLDDAIKGYENLADGVKLDDAFKFLIELAASDTVGIQDSATINRQNAIAILDSFVISGLATTRITAYNAITAVIGLLEYVDKGLSADILETIGLTEDTVSAIGLVSAILEQLGLSESTDNVVGIYTEVSESYGVSDTVLTSAILQNLIEDGAIISTTILGPGTAVYKGWVMNSENFAVTNYGNYKFTDMALLNGQYLGVMDDGVYLLEGNTDSGANIGARLTTAALEFGTSSLKTITQMYLGFRGDGDVILIMTSDEDETTYYQLNTIDSTLHTDRLTGAKGQVGRYWQFEIISNDSTKLDLDTFEVHPIVWGRKL